MKKFDIIPTAAGHVCSECGRGFYCWTGPDESPCRHDLEQFKVSALKAYLKRVPENEEVKDYLSKDKWTIDLRTGMLKKNGKSTGVSFAEVATSKEFREVISNEIDNEILSELLAKSPKCKELLKK